MTHVVAFLAYPVFQLLDVTGPAAAFDEANHVRLRQGATPFYRVEVLSAAGGAVASSSGIQVQTQALARLSPSTVGTLLISGAREECLLRAMRDPVVAGGSPGSCNGRSGSVRSAPACSCSLR